MRRNLLEGVIIGGMIGILVMLVPVLAAGVLQTQWILLGVGVLLLCLAQIALIVRRARRATAVGGEAPDEHASTEQRYGHNSFAQELDESWTGLTPSDEWEPEALIDTGKPGDFPRMVSKTVVTPTHITPSSRPSDDNEE